LADSRETAILVGLDLKRPAELRADAPGAAESLDELAALAESAGADVVARHLQSRDAPEAATLVGSGKLREIAAQAEAFHADLVLFDHDLTPTQLRNLEKVLPCKVVDRTQLILDIFARRARTREGQLQVELAQLNYLLPRLTGRGASMSRLGGGIGTRGPGETQLETDRRKISRRIKKIGDQIESIRSHRGIQRRQRQAVPLATVALVGYTNAGKSTLFNRLTGAGVLADARMFATLDTTVRHLVLPSRRRALLSDTVGFIRNLPAELVKAFRATLEEVTEAALLLHVVDPGSPWAAEHVRQVYKVLSEINASAAPQILVLSKMDRFEPGAEAATLARRILLDAGAAPAEFPPAVAVSAHTGTGLQDLIALIDQQLPVDRLVRMRLRIPSTAGPARHMVHEYCHVLAEEWVDDSCMIEADVAESLVSRFRDFVVTEMG